MSGILIYTESEARRNEFAIEKFRENLDIMLVDENYRGKADFVINRTNSCTIAKYYEEQGVRVFNPSSLSRLANDKQLCYDFMEKHGIPVLETRYKGEPVIKKSIDGHGGSEVFFLDKNEKHEKGYVYQKPCDTSGKDLRVWVIGKKIITSILRESKTDFRSNFCLGGSASPYELSRKERQLVERVMSLVDSDYIGIDFLFNNGELVFNEIEDTVGARMVYAKTDIDIIKLYCEYIGDTLCSEK